MSKSRTTTTQGILRKTKIMADGKIKIYEYNTIKGKAVNEYMREYMKARYTPKKRIPKYEKLDKLTRDHILYLRSVGLGINKICKATGIKEHTCRNFLKAHYKKGEIPTFKQLISC